MRLYKIAADKGNAVAQCAMGIAYQRGKDLPHNEEASIKYLKLAANQGDGQALYELACFHKDDYEKNSVLLRDRTKEYEYFKKSVENGFTPALEFLGGCYQLGIGTDKNDYKAFECFKKAADKGYPHSMFECAMSMKNGTGTEVDTQGAWNYLNKSAANGDIFAKHFLALAYFEGDGVRQNFDIAFKLFKEAANEDCFFSFMYMGICYEQGLGTTKDIVKAIMWFEKASLLPLKDQENIIKHLEVLKKQNGG